MTRNIQSTSNARKNIPAKLEYACHLFLHQTSLSEAPSTPIKPAKGIFVVVWRRLNATTITN